MTKEEAKKAAEVMLAYAEGRKVEYKRDDGTWCDCASPSFNWYGNACEFRIKPEPKYRPFKDNEECWQEMQKHQPFGWIKSFTKFKTIVDITSEVHVAYEGMGFTFEKAYDRFTFADGTPFGMLEEEE